jgi:hypothetical protein
VGSSSPFTKRFTPDTAMDACLSVCCGGGWVEYDRSVCLARCWVLRGHPGWGVFSGRAHHGASNVHRGASFVGVWVWVVVFVWWGVVVC